MPRKKTIIHQEEKEEKMKDEKGKYIETIGRRKTAVARVRLFAKKSNLKDDLEIIVNEKPYKVYFNYEKDQKTAQAPFKELSLKGYKVQAKVKGGGIKSQAEAIRLGISRALVKLNPLWRSPLKTLGFLKRDPRMVERKKYGMRKARRPQQWRKR
jgi:small subunit ribosomal protein S9